MFFIVVNLLFLDGMVFWIVFGVILDVYENEVGYDVIWNIDCSEVMRFMF